MKWVLVEVVPLHHKNYLLEVTLVTLEQEIKKFCFVSWVLI